MLTMLMQLGESAEVAEKGFEWTADVVLMIAAVPMTIGVAIFAGWIFWRANKEDELLRKQERTKPPVGGGAR